MSSLSFLNAFFDRRTFMKLCVRLAYQTALAAKNGGVSIVDDFDCPLDPFGAAMLYAMPNPDPDDPYENWGDVPVAVYAGPDMGDPAPSLSDFEDEPIDVYGGPDKWAPEDLIPEEVVALDVYGGPDDDRSKRSRGRNPLAQYPLNFSVAPLDPDED